MILLGADALSQFLNRAAERPFAWGRHDCLLWLADWVLERTGKDPAADLRGTYATLLGAARIVQAAGGMTRLVESRLEPLGAVRASVGQRGAIAVVSVAGDGGSAFDNEAGAILLDGTAALICQAGLMLPRWSDVPLVAAWKI